MSQSDAVLLERFSRRADAVAFAELVQRYAKLVYSTSWRVLKHEPDAADVTQETFFELMRQAGRIAGPLSGWLHRVATQKSIDVIRRRIHRRDREQTYADARPPQVRSWRDLSPSVDEALEKLSEAAKSLLLEHFLAARPWGRSPGNRASPRPPCPAGSMRAWSNYGGSSGARVCSWAAPRSARC
jgi:RNA polymerase sigma factor (sigma-70 family)